MIEQTKIDLAVIGLNAISFRAIFLRRFGNCCDNSKRYKGAKEWRGTFLILSMCCKIMMLA